jgi:hypothetical protein
VKKLRRIENNTDTADIMLPHSLSAHITEAGTFLLAIAILTKLYQIEKNKLKTID